MNKETLGNSQAFASIAVEKNQTFGSTGLTKKEYFAAMAMQGLLTNDRGYDLDYEKLSYYALRHADALIEELNKETQQHDTNIPNTI
jgi:hypothetical protein